MSKTIHDRTLALAGLFQATSLVNQVAQRGAADQAPLETSIRSLFATDPEQAEDVYGSSTELRYGLEVLTHQFGAIKGTERNLLVTRYAMALLILERKLTRSPQMLQTISRGIARARTQLDHFPLTHENVLASLADTYLHTISGLSPRVMVSGEHTHLNHSDNANKIRALLLAGIRSAVLWRQCGGSRLQLIFKRRALVEEAQRLLGRG